MIPKGWLKYSTLSLAKTCQNKDSTWEMFKNVHVHAEISVNYW